MLVVGAVGACVVGALAFGAWSLFASPDSAPSSPPRTAAKAAPSPAARPEVAKPAAEPTETTPAPAADPARPATLTIAAVGDMMFDRKVGDLVSAQGGAAPLDKVATALADADVAVGNLESTLAKSGKANATKDVTFRGKPAGIEGLKLAGFDAVSLANNHMLDYGPEPLADTIASLDAAGIGHAGAGATRELAWKPATIERDGASVAYIAVTHIVPPGFLVGDERAGVASGRMDPAMLKTAITEAKKTHDYVIVSFHWGVEYQPDANGDQQAWAHKAIDAGADMVLAHHPHVIQGVEFYKKGLIAYSLGDFVFDHYSRETGESFILNAELGPDGVTAVTAKPVYLTDSHGKPQFVSGKEAATILSRLKKISAPLGSTVTIDGDTARIEP